MGQNGKWQREQHNAKWALSIITGLNSTKQPYNVFVFHVGQKLNILSQPMWLHTIVTLIAEN